MKYLLLFIFLACLLYYVKPAFQDGFENLQADASTPHATHATQSSDTVQIELPGTKCPTTLLEKDGKYFLFNTKRPYKEGTNPIEFDHLEDYASFVKRENKRGNKCPVLFLQQSYNPQGKREYKIRPSPLDLQGGAPPIGNVTKQTYLDMFKGTGLLVDATQSDKPYNVNSYPAFDPMNQQVGIKTPLDLMNQIQQTKDQSPNPDDPNWGGNTFTQNLVDNGYYAKNEIFHYTH
jgi:hypothetical protein